MKKVLTVLATAALCASTIPASAAEPIEGTWIRSSGVLIKFAKAGGNEYCGTVLTGEYSGQSIGCMSGTGGKYEGSIKVLDEGKTYTGKAKAVGANKLKLSGCVLGGIICKSENLSRQ